MDVSKFCNFFGAVANLKRDLQIRFGMAWEDLSLPPILVGGADTVFWHGNEINVESGWIQWGEDVMIYHCGYSKEANVLVYQNRLERGIGKWELMDRKVRA